MKLSKMFLSALAAPVCAVMMTAPFAAQAANPVSQAQVAVAPPVFAMKLACKGEICAPPSRSPFSPAASISRPAKSPSGFLNTEPQEGILSGCVRARCANSRSILFSLYSTPRGESTRAGLARTLEGA